MATSAQNKQIAETFKQKVAELGFTYTVRGEILTISKSFTPEDNDGFIECDMNGPYLLSLIPSTSAGSVWGTDGGSVGGYSALKHGCYHLNKSGCSKIVLKLLQ